jgi:hypothetical protein
MTLRRNKRFPHLCPGRDCRVCWWLRARRYWSGA